MAAYYNENDPLTAAWLREVMAHGLIAPGDVDERDIRDIRPDELVAYTQCHFFAGIGGWSYALRLAGWPDERPAWTGSCRCQPYSAAGKRGGFADERHLWPHWFHLLEVCRPGVVFGEQVASKDGLTWFDLVQADLEGAGYACGGFDLCAAGIGAPEIRQRLWFVAERMGDPDDARSQGWSGVSERAGQRTVGAGGVAGRVVQPDGSGSQPRQERGEAARHGSAAESASCDGGLSDTKSVGYGTDDMEPEQGRRECSVGQDGGEIPDGASAAGPTNGFWRAADWLYCRYGKWRPVEPGTFPLADGIPARVGRLRGYGNAIVPQVAAEVIGAYMEEMCGL